MEIFLLCSPRLQQAGFCAWLGEAGLRSRRGLSAAGHSRGLRCRREAVIHGRLPLHTHVFVMACMSTSASRTLLAV